MIDSTYCPPPKKKNPTSYEFLSFLTYLKLFCSFFFWRGGGGGKNLEMKKTPMRIFFSLISLCLLIHQNLNDTKMHLNFSKSFKQGGIKKLMKIDELELNKINNNFF